MAGEQRAHRDVGLNGLAVGGCEAQPWRHAGRLDELRGRAARGGVFTKSAGEDQDNVGLSIGRCGQCWIAACQQCEGDHVCIVAGIGREMSGVELFLLLEPFQGLMEGMMTFLWWRSLLLGARLLLLLELWLGLMMFLLLLKTV